MKILRRFSIWGKLSSRQSSSTFQDFILTSPPEILEELFKWIPLQDLLTCRALCSPIRHKVEEHISHKLKVVIRDSSKGKKWKLTSPMTLHTNSLEVMNLTRTRPTRIFTMGLNLSVLDFKGFITTAAFVTLTSGIPTLQHIKICSLTLGGRLDFAEVSKISKRREWPNGLKFLELVLDYVPLSTEGFSAHRLITNLRNLQGWAIKLNQLTYNILASPQHEQFYIGFHSIVTSVPKSSYNTIKTLKIICPKLKTEDSRVETAIQSTLQAMKNLENLEIHFLKHKQSQKDHFLPSQTAIIDLLNVLGITARITVEY